MKDSEGLGKFHPELEYQKDDSLSQKESYNLGILRRG
jgi:hypothetical protein